MNTLNFQPLPGLSSNHLQTIIASYFPPGEPPPSTNWLINLKDGDCLSCEVSIPVLWTKLHPTIILVHGMGGNGASSYMIRMSRKFYQRGYRVVRVNLRGCGTGTGLAKRPYNAGTSEDVLNVINLLKEQTPLSELTVIGFSLGGNIILKLAGELEGAANEWVKLFIAVCAPLDLAQAVSAIQEDRNRLYHLYYLKRICAQAQPWLSSSIDTLYEFDERVSAPLWGYKGAQEYYQKCSSIRFLPKIKHTTHLLFAEDDPFVPFEGFREISLPENVHLWTSKQGGHMGFIGKASNANSPFWMDHVLLNWVEGDFESDRQMQEV